jgi:glucan endo-1,3-alpha-glucosidase
MPHTALMDFAGPYIKAFKAGLGEPVIDREMLVYWYRPMMKDIDCDGTDACRTRPDGWQFVEDTVFVASFSKTSGSVKVTSGGKVVEKDIGAGVTMLEFDMAVGDQTFEMTTSTAKLSGKSAQAVLGSCWVSNQQVFGCHLSFDEADSDGSFCDRTEPLITLISIPGCSPEQ